MTPDSERRFAEALEAAKLEAMAEFAAGAGHEINNPLTVIAGRAQMLLREEKDDERRRALALINAQAMRIYEMIADMRLFARPPRPELQLLDPGELIARLIDEMTPAAAQQGTVLCRVGQVSNVPSSENAASPVLPGRLETCPTLISADPIQLMVALRALCQNALEALGRGGRIEISLTITGKQVEISISDDGPGIPPEQRQHIFDPFYSARQAGRGLGMGLAKCWRIVAGQGGQIAVDAGPAGGAKFTIIVPRAL
jgi:signal transduction histidine kinase